MSADEQLSARLEAVLRLVPPCRHLVDVGCDHAWVPLAAVRRGLAARATGVERAAAPLAQARRNVEAWGDERVRVLQADGLQGWMDDTVDVVVMAGLGARTMLRVIEGAPLRLQEQAAFILQPNTEWPHARAWARARGWHVQTEKMVTEQGRYFWTSRVQAAAGGDPAYAAEAAPGTLPAAWQWEAALDVLGPCLWRAAEPTYVQWLEQEAGRQRRLAQRREQPAQALALLFEWAVADMRLRGANTVGGREPDDRGGV